MNNFNVFIIILKSNKYFEIYMKMMIISSKKIILILKKK